MSGQLIRCVAHSRHVELGHRLAPLVGSQMCIAQGHRDGAVTEEMADGVQRHPAVNQAGGEVMAPISPAT
jgi:hypothetical protein